MPYGTESTALEQGYEILYAELHKLPPEIIVKTSVRLERIGDTSIMTVRLYDQQKIDWTWVIIRGILLAVTIFLLYHFG